MSSTSEGLGDSSSSSTERSSSSWSGDSFCSGEAPLENGHAQSCESGDADTTLEDVVADGLEGSPVHNSRSTEPDCSGAEIADVQPDRSSADIAPGAGLPVRTPQSRACSLRSTKRKAREYASTPAPMPGPKANHNLLELSITVGYLGADVHPEEMDKLDHLLREKCVSGLVSIERGEVEAHLHFQMVVRAYGTTTRAFGGIVRKYMGWDKPDSQEKGKGKITCKALVQRNLHTFSGMLGYCLKDEGQEHFKTVAKNITEDNIKEGRTLHQLYGRDPKRKVILTSRNLYERALMYYRYSEKKLISRTFAGILLGMMKSTRYYPSASWVIPTHGRGMDIRRASSLWTCTLQPHETTLEDVFNVFFDNRSPVRGRYHKDEFEHVEEVQRELEGISKEAARKANLPSPPQDPEPTEELGDLTWKDDFVPLVQKRAVFNRDYLYFTPPPGEEERRQAVEEAAAVETVEVDGRVYDRLKGKAPMFSEGNYCPMPDLLNEDSQQPVDDIVCIEEICKTPPPQASCSYATAQASCSRDSGASQQLPSSSLGPLPDSEPSRFFLALGNNQRRVRRRLRVQSMMEE